MFDFLYSFDSVLVCGPQRSGTTIVARCISHDLNYKYIDEDYIGWVDVSKNDEDFLRSLFSKEMEIVAQAPACSHICHEFDLPWVAVVFVMRKIEDIVASQRRIKWEYEKNELNKYPSWFWKPTIAETKYNYWNVIQRPQIQNAFEIQYESLRGHELWVDKEYRKNFKARQWQKGR